MSPRPAPDLDERRRQVTVAALALGESEGWGAVTMRRLAAELGVTQPVLYSAFPAGRQALLDAVAVRGFDGLAEALEAVESEPLARMRAYLDFAAARPHLYDAMFSMPSGLEFGTGRGPAALGRAFAALRDAFPEPDAVRTEVAWAALHGLAALQTSGRLPPAGALDRLAFAHRALT
jgi:AcrR family transcriptional regulator